MSLEYKQIEDTYSRICPGDDRPRLHPAHILTVNGIDLCFSCRRWIGSSIAVCDACGLIIHDNPKCEPHTSDYAVYGAYYYRCADCEEIG